MKPAELQTQLKTLRLGGMLHTLELRRAQAEDQRLGHLEFLALLLDHEIDRRQFKMLAERLHRAHFEEEKTLEEFDWSYNPQIPAEQLRNLATCAFVERHESVLLCGPVGVGKTHAAQALGHAACRAGHTVLFTKTTAMLRDLAGGRADGSWEPRLRRYLPGRGFLRADLRALPRRQHGGDQQPLPSGLVRPLPQPSTGRKRARPPGAQRPPRDPPRPDLPAAAPPRWRRDGEPGER
jgi:hypothetical protein